MNMWKKVRQHFMEFISKATCVIHNCSTTIARKIVDFYASRFKPFKTFSIGLLIVYGIFLFQVVARTTDAAILGSWQMFLDALPQFSAVVIVYAITVIILVHVRRIACQRFIDEPESRPQILWEHRIAKALFKIFYVSYNASTFTGIALLSFYGSSSLVKQLSLQIFSALVTFTLILFLVFLPLHLRMSDKEIAIHCIDYLIRIQGQDKASFMGAIGFIARQIADRLHKLFLDSWSFAQEINLWPQLNVVFMGLTCGNEKERTETVAFLEKIVKMLSSAETPKDYRQMAESISEFQMTMTSLDAIRDEIALIGKPEVRRPTLEKIKGYAPIATILGTIVALLAFIIQMVISWLS